MKITTHLNCPDKVMTGMVGGTLIREGGTIRDVTSGRIVTLLREASLLPGPSDKLVGPVLGDILQFGWNPFPLLNLGATVGFGIATLSKLNAIAKKMNRIDRKIDGIGWVVELTFAHTLQVLRTTTALKKLVEQKVLTNLESAAELAFTAQEFAPESRQRIQRLENALTLATQESRFLLRRSVDDMSRLGDEFSKMRIGRWRPMIDHLEEAADVALRFRHTCLAVSLKASIEAEAGGIGQAGSSLHRDLEKLQEVLKHFARGYFRRQNYFIYDYLVHRYWKGRITFSRVMALAKEYDRDVQNEDGFMELLMTNDCPDAHPIFEDHKDWQDSTMPKIGAVFELLEGATSDTDRMRGLTNELGLADTRKMRLQDYREQLAVQDLPADGNVVYFETEDEGLEGAA